MARQTLGEGNAVKGSADFKNNNLDCLRLILASIVALFHVGALTNLPAFSALGTWLSPNFAVRSFFVISGLLIYRSYDRSTSLRSYLDKRVRRIYPAYATVILVCAVALSAFSTLPLSEYFAHGFLRYLGANLLFLNFLAPSLPGVFTHNTVTAVDGALWTLKIEVAFYLSVPVIHYMCRRLGTKLVIVSLFLLSCLWKYGFAFLATVYHSGGVFSLDPSRSLFSQLEVQFPGQLVYFLAGILLLLWFDRLTAHFRIVAAATAVLFLLDQFVTRDVLDVLWIAGFVLIFGFWRHLGNFAKHGDFSYGVYIVHWPILQILIALRVDRLNPALFLLIAASAIAATAFLLWNLVESRFLASSSHYREVSLDKAESRVPPGLRALRSWLRKPGTS